MNGHLRHDAFLYDSDDRLVERVAAFIEGGLSERSATVLVLRPSSQALLREALGPSFERVSLVADPQEWYTSPAAAIAAYDARIRSYRGDGVDAVRVVGELPLCSAEAQWDDWISYEATLNHVFETQPCWILCVYDERVLPARVVDSAWITHERVLVENWSASERYGESPGVQVEPGRPHPPAAPG
jgi:hypothetical protein